MTLRLRRGAQALILAAACAAGPMLGGVAHAAGGSVNAFVECVWTNSDGSRTAAYGYTNSTGAAVTIPVGGDNRFTSKPDDRGQPTVFQPGTVHNAFVVNYADSTAAWHVPGADAIANPSATKCAAAPVPIVGNWLAALLTLVVAVPVAAAVLRRSSRFRALRYPVLHPRRD